MRLVGLGLIGAVSLVASANAAPIVGDIGTHNNPEYCQKRLTVVASACIRTATARTEWIVALRPTRADFRTAVADIIAPTAMITAAIIKNKALLEPRLGPAGVGRAPKKEPRRRQRGSHQRLAPTAT